MRGASLILAGIFVAYSLFAAADDLVPLKSVLEIHSVKNTGQVLSAEIDADHACSVPQTQTVLRQPESGVIELYHHASKGDCSSVKEAKVDFYLGDLPDGSYVVVDGASSSTLARFTLQKGEVFTY
jgi:hypothetical protein